MSNPSVLGAITYEAETNWAENVATFATLRVPTIGAVDVSGLTHEKIPSDRTVQYRGDGTDPVLGTMGGSLTMESYLTGHGSSTAGAVAVNAYETFLGRIFGGTPAVAAASGTTLTGGTANIPITAASGTFAAGALAFIGSLNDGDGNGQAYAIASHVGNDLTLLTDLDDTPANGALVGAPTMLFANSSPTAVAITGTRLLAQTANLQYRCHGCFPQAGSITGLSVGELPRIRHTWGVSAWGYSTATFPSVVATHSANPGAVVNGSLWVNDVGTPTHALRVCRSFQIDYTLGVERLDGPGGVWLYQKTIGAVRTPDTVKLTWTEDADAATTTPTLPGYGTATTRKHVLYTCSTADGSRLAFYFPSVCIDNVAVQRMDGNINRLTIEATAYVGPTLTSELTRSPMRIAFG